MIKYTAFLGSPFRLFWFRIVLSSQKLVPLIQKFNVYSLNTGFLGKFNLKTNNLG